MKNLTILFSLLILSGCSTVVPVKHKFPEAPNTIMTKCSDLNKMSENSNLSQITKTITQNYTLYHECSVKNDAWIEWYKNQKQIFEGKN
jgi:hypothetical protein